jgi:hypothetical protein
VKTIERREPRPTNQRVVAIAPTRIRICYLLFPSLRAVNLKSALILIFGLGLFCSPVSSFAQEPAQTPMEPIRVGVFIVSTFNVDPNKGSYTVLFYLWSSGPVNEADPLSALQFPRAITTTLLSQNQEIRGNTRWILKSFRCEMLNEWDLHSYPFDEHTLSVAFRVAPLEGKTLAIDLDTADSGIAQKRIEGGWQIADFQLFKYRLSYQSNFGDPADGQKPTDWIVASFKLTRLPLGALFSSNERRVCFGADSGVRMLIKDRASSCFFRPNRHAGCLSASCRSQPA